MKTSVVADERDRRPPAGVLGVLEVVYGALHPHSVKQAGVGRAESPDVIRKQHGSLDDGHAGPLRKHELAAVAPKLRGCDRLDPEARGEAAHWEHALQVGKRFLQLEIAEAVPDDLNRRGEERHDEFGGEDCDELGARDVEVGTKRGLAVVRRPKLLLVGRVKESNWPMMYDMSWLVTCKLKDRWQECQ